MLLTVCAGIALRRALFRVEPVVKSQRSTFSGRFGSLFATSPAVCRHGMPSRACGWRRCRIRELRHSRSMPRQTPLPPELGTGPFTVAEAHALGLTEGRLRCDDLTRPSYGVRRFGPAEGMAQLAEATSLVLPVRSAFSHVTAARTLGLPVSHRWAPTEPLHVMNVTTAPVVRRVGCQGHRGLESRRVVPRTGLRVVSAEDTWCDL